MIHGPCCHSSIWRRAAPRPAGILVPDLVSEAENRNGIAYGHLDLACFEALVSTPQGRAGHVGDAGTWSLPLGWGRSRTAKFSHGGSLVTGAGAGTPAAQPVGVTVRWLIPSPSRPRPVACCQPCRPPEPGEAAGPAGAPVPGGDGGLR
jgi:hypothetical protein